MYFFSIGAFTFCVEIKYQGGILPAEEKASAEY